MESLTRYLGVELIEKHIHVNAVSPGLVETDALRHFAAVGDYETLRKRFIDQVPTGRLVTPEDVAGVVEFLCSPAASRCFNNYRVTDFSSKLFYIINIFKNSFASRYNRYPIV